MILPVYSYGNKILNQPTEEIDPGHEGLAELIDNMWETMYACNGVGLAAPQVGHGIAVLVMDAGMLDDQYEGVKRVMINPDLTELSDNKVSYEEGCLSIPNIREEIKRPEKIKVSYEDENFEFREETFDSIPARIIQHEIDHLDGILFTDRISRLRKRLISKKLDQIAKGYARADYPMEFPSKKRKTAG